jgi:hypothetical protein
MEVYKAPAVAAGPAGLVIRATTKVGGKDYAVTPPPAVIEITEPKTDPPKKEEPKKDKKSLVSPLAALHPGAAPQAADVSWLSPPRTRPP